MERKYTKLDLKTLIHFEWDAFKTSCKVKKTGIWLFERNASEYRWLSDEERDLLLSHPDKDANKPVLPFPFTLDEFLKFATLPAFELREFYTFADNTIDENAIERLGRTRTPAWELARALMFGERPKCISPEAEQGELAIADAESIVTASASVGVEPAKAGPLPLEQGLSTKDIAHVFDGVYGWNAERWTKNLSASKWLHSARIAIGVAGGVSSVWSPLMLAQLMHDRKNGEREKEKLMKVFNSQFTRNPALGPWHDAFNEYFATHCDAD